MMKMLNMKTDIGYWSSGICHWVLFGTILGWFVPSTSAQSLAERARKMNRRELTADEAIKQQDEEEPDRRNKICMRRIKPAMPGVDWNTDPTAIPYMLY